MILITFCYCNSISSRIFQGEKYPPLAKMLELEQEKSQFNDSMEYLKALKERPKKLKIRMARIRDEPQGWDQKESGK